TATCAVSEQAADAHKKVWGRKAIWATFEIFTDEKENREIRPVSVGTSTDTIQECVKTLNDKKCVFILYDHKSTGKLGRQLEKTHFIFWLEKKRGQVQKKKKYMHFFFKLKIRKSPKNCSQQERIMYSAYLVNFRDGLKYAQHITCSEPEDFKMFSAEGDESDEESDISL
ncbi:hypothetical protein RFI_32699, partial [Reticulomyxa filosa]